MVADDDDDVDDVVAGAAAGGSGMPLAEASCSGGVCELAGCSSRGGAFG